MAYTAVIAQPITLLCAIVANPDANTVFWQKTDAQGNYRTVPLVGNKYSGSNVNFPSLTIQDSHTSDAGNYRCAATNSVGTGYSSAIRLDVGGGMLYGTR